MRFSQFLHLILQSLQQRLVLAVRASIREPLIHTAGHFGDPPAPLLLCVDEKLLVILKAAPAAFREVDVGPDAGEGVRGREDEEDPVLEVVEQERAQKRHGKVCKPPYND